MQQSVMESKNCLGGCGVVSIQQGCWEKDFHKNTVCGDFSMSKQDI